MDSIHDQPSKVHPFTTLPATYAAYLGSNLCLTDALCQSLFTSFFTTSAVFWILTVWSLSPHKQSLRTLHQCNPASLHSAPGLCAQPHVGIKTVVGLPSSIWREINKRGNKWGGIKKRVVCLCQWMTLCHCKPLVECDCSSNLCNDWSSCSKGKQWRMGESALVFCRPLIPFIESQEILIRVGSGFSGQMCKESTRPPRTTDQKHLRLLSTLWSSTETRTICARPPHLKHNHMRPLFHTWGNSTCWKHKVSCNYELWQQTAW